MRTWTKLNSTAKNLLLIAALLSYLTGCAESGSGDSAPDSKANSVKVNTQPPGPNTAFISPIYPTNGSTDVPVDIAAIRASYSDINGSSIQANNISASPNITGTVTLVGSSEIQFEPDSALLANTTYTIAISGLVNTSGDPVDSITWSFTTSDANPVTRTTYFISPSGNDNNSGQADTLPWRTFDHAFSNMLGADELILLDGVYSLAAGTGGIHWDTSQFDTNTAQPPSGMDINNLTLIRAENPGNVFVDVPLFLGRSFRKDSYIKFHGITFTDGGKLYNTSYITVKDSGFNGQLSIGTVDHDNGNTYNLIEDVWIWAAQKRIVAKNYRAHNNIWRRVVIRGDGCNVPSCLGSGNPNVALTFYESRDSFAENVIIIDRILNGGDSYADFATAQHTNDNNLRLGRNEWLGCMTVNSVDNALKFEADYVISGDPTWTIKNFIAVGTSGDGVNIGYSGTATPNVLENITVSISSSASGGNDDGIRMAPGQDTSTLRNVIASNATNYGINSDSQPSYSAVFEADGSDYNQTTCATGCYNDASGSFDANVLYPVRVESNSLLKGAGFNGADIGATVLYQYGVSGTRSGDAGHNTLTTTPLWPWPNEARIRSEMCASTTRGFCENRNSLDGTTPLTLTSYIWEFYGNQIPDNVYNP